MQTGEFTILKCSQNVKHGRFSLLKQLHLLQTYSNILKVLSQGVIMETKKIFGERLRELRNSLSISQMQLANALGMTQNSIGMMERGHRGTTIEKVVLLAKYFHVSADYLLGITDDPTWRGTEE